MNNLNFIIMSKNDNIILDSSTLICLISKEVGFEIAANIIPKAITNIVRMAEIIRFLSVKICL